MSILVDFWYLWLLGAIALVTYRVTSNLPHGRLWVTAAAVSFILSSYYWTARLPYTSVFGAATNFIIAIMILTMAQRKWELLILRCFQFMILVDMIDVWGNVAQRPLVTHRQFAITLEIANWTVLAIVLLTGMSERMRHKHAHRSRTGHHRHRWVYLAERSLFAARHPAKIPFWIKRTR